MTLRVTLEIVPFGDESKKRIIETINVSNLGRYQGDDSDLFQYVIEHNNYKNYTDTTPRVSHFRKDGAICLAYKALQHLFYSNVPTTNNSKI